VISDWVRLRERAAGCSTFAIVCSHQLQTRGDVSDHPSNLAAVQVSARIESARGSKRLADVGAFDYNRRDWRPRDNRAAKD